MGNKSANDISLSRLYPNRNSHKRYPLCELSSENEFTTYFVACGVLHVLCAIFPYFQNREKDSIHVVI